MFTEVRSQNGGKEREQLPPRGGAGEARPQAAGEPWGALRGEIQAKKNRSYLAAVNCFVDGWSCHKGERHQKNHQPKEVKPQGKMAETMLHSDILVSKQRISLLHSFLSSRAQAENAAAAQHKALKPLYNYGAGIHSSFQRKLESRKCYTLDSGFRCALPE